MNFESLTNKISSILAVAKSPSWFMVRKINAIVTMICLDNGKCQVIVVTHIHKWVSKHVNGRNHLSLWETVAKDEEENRDKKKGTTTRRENSATHFGMCLLELYFFLGFEWVEVHKCWIDILSYPNTEMNGTR